MSLHESEVCQSFVQVSFEQCLYKEGVEMMDRKVQENVKVRR